MSDWIAMAGCLVSGIGILYLVAFDDERLYATGSAKFAALLDVMGRELVWSFYLVLGISLSSAAALLATGLVALP
jgi:hypothetical protein